MKIQRREKRAEGSNRMVQEGIMKMLFFILSIGTIVFPGCRPKKCSENRILQQVESDVAKAVAARVAVYVSHMKACGVEGMLDFFSDSDAFVPVPLGG
jgi:hypothetical protein